MLGYHYLINISENKMYVVCMKNVSVAGNTRLCFRAKAFQFDFWGTCTAWIRWVLNDISMGRKGSIWLFLAGEEMTELAEKRDSQTAVCATWIQEGSVRLATFFF